MPRASPVCDAPWLVLFIKVSALFKVGEGLAFVVYKGDGDEWETAGGPAVGILGVPRKLDMGGRLVDIMAGS